MSDRIPSPCVRLCTLDETGTSCLGCHRSLEEIMGWTTYSDDEKRRIMARLPERRGTVRPRRD